MQRCDGWLCFNCSNLSTWPYNVWLMTFVQSPVVLSQMLLFESFVLIKSLNFDFAWSYHLHHLSASHQFKLLLKCCFLKSWVSLRLRIQNILCRLINDSCWIKYSNDDVDDAISYVKLYLNYPFIVVFSMYTAIKDSSSVKVQLIWKALTAAILLERMKVY